MKIYYFYSSNRLINHGDKMSRPSNPLGKDIELVCSGVNLVTVIHIVENHNIKIKSRHYNKQRDQYLLTLANVSDEKFNLLKNISEVSKIQKSVVFDLGV